MSVMQWIVLSFQLVVAVIWIVAGVKYLKS